jgi:hypothetical protein
VAPHVITCHNPSEKCIFLKIIHLILSLEVPEARRVLLGDFRVPFHGKSVKFNLRIGGRRRRP